MNGHLYATRTATLEYQRHVGGGFEAARRDLTERLLRRMNGSGPGIYALHVPATGVHDNRRAQAMDFSARVQKEGALLVITQLERV